MLKNLSSLSLILKSLAFLLIFKQSTNTTTHHTKKFKDYGKLPFPAPPITFGIISQVEPGVEMAFRWKKQSKV